MSEYMPDPNDIIGGGGGGAPTAKFAIPGTAIGGRILEPPQSYQEREYVQGNPGGGEPKRFPSGDFIYGVKVTVQTDLRDPAVEDDDGKRRIFIEGKRMKEAVKAAVLLAQSKLEVGGELHVTFTGTEGVNDAKKYEARYTAAGAAAANAALGVTPAPAASDPAPDGFTQLQWDAFSDTQKNALRTLQPAGDIPPF